MPADDAPQAALLFPGQGAQHVGMGKDLVESRPEAQQLFDRARDVLGFDLAEICFHGPASKLDTTAVSQPALYVCSLAALKKLQEDSPDLVAGAGAAAGLSLGEYTALVYADALDFESGLRLVAERGKAMQAAADASPGGMVSLLGMEQDEVEQWIEKCRDDDVLEIANLLCPRNVVVSGSKAACQRIGDAIEQASAGRVVHLAVAGAFHTELMEPAVARLKAALDEVEIRAPRVPVISNVDAGDHSDPDTIRAQLLEQLVSPVRWEDSMRTLLDRGFNRFYEVGPGRVLRGLLKRMSRRTPCVSVLDGS